MKAESVTQRIIVALFNNKIPWRNDYGFPTNISSRLKYTGVNPLLLNIATEEGKHTSQWWGTWSQWRAQGREIKQRPENLNVENWGAEIVLQKEDKNLRRWHLYNLDQIEGGFEVLRENHVADYSQVDTLIEATAARIEYRFGLLACYLFPPLDHVILPLKEQFVTGPGGLGGFYNSVFHELVHWTEPRLKWTGSEAERELRAEIGADFLTSELRTPRLPLDKRANHRAFVGRWINMLSNDNDAIFRITEAASQAVDYILAFNNMKKPRHNPFAEEVNVTT